MISSLVGNVMSQLLIGSCLLFYLQAKENRKNKFRMLKIRMYRNLSKACMCEMKTNVIIKEIKRRKKHTYKII